MAALDRLDDLEEFCLDLEPATSSAQRLWQLPLTGLHDYTLPATIAERLGGRPSSRPHSPKLRSSSSSS